MLDGHCSATMINKIFINQLCSTPSDVKETLVNREKFIDKIFLRNIANFLRNEESFIFFNFVTRACNSSINYHMLNSQICV